MLIVVVAVVVLGILAALLTLSASKAIAKKPRVLLDATTAGQREKVIGTVGAAAQPLVAPLSGRACVCYKLEISEIDGAKSKSLVSETRGEPFTLQDERGRAVVSTADITFFKMSGDVVSGSTGRATPEVKALLDARNITVGTKLGAQKTLDFRESAVVAGARVTVIGMVVHADGGVRLDKVVVTDDPKLTA